MAKQQVRRGGRLTGLTVSPLDLRIEATRTESEARALQVHADALRAVADRLACTICTVAISVPVDASGALVLARAYGTHELGCPA